EDATLRAGRERPPLLRLDRVEEGRRARCERAVGEELQPAEMGAAGIRPERVAAPQPGRGCRLDLLLADAGVDADGQRATLVERPERGDAGAEALLERQPARTVDSDDAQADEVRRQLPDQRL